MASPPTRTVALVRHAETRSTALSGICAQITRTADGIVAVRYSLAGDLARLRVPPPRAPRIAERLWAHTCCELFVARRGAPGYHEFNFAPSGEWAVYAFVRYREGGMLTDERLAPEIAVRTAAGALQLDARVRLGALSPAHRDDALALGLSVVVEDDAGALSYWALGHPPGRPDFHHPDAFALALDEVRH